MLYRYVNAVNWMIDSSCDEASGKEGFVRDTMMAALTMGEAARDALAPPLSQGVQHAVNYLFEADPSQATTWSSSVFGQDNGMTRLTTEVFAKTALNSFSVKIYCDQSRIKRRMKRGFLYHFDQGKILSRISHAYSLLIVINRYRNGVTERRILVVQHFAWGMVYTVVPVDPTISVQEDQPFMQIQICPTFLSWALAQADGNLWTRKLSPSAWKRMSVNSIKEIILSTFYAPIDGVSLVDKMMLAHANRIYSTSDVRYGWPRCRKLAAVVTGPNGVKGPDKNADTWALLASIAWQVENNRITDINEDGSLVVA
ncbi:hypothetical protein F5884DRAFT_848373 [Xylogone sp. PMI_703]|nr:hypothetical protein F5884DRAFT_848373 [Xylogone sp. PMI_703]